MKNFFSQFKTWVHVAAGLIATGVSFYVYNDTVHKAVNSAVGPKLAAVIGGFAAIVLAYANSQKPQPAPVTPINQGAYKGANTSLLPTILGGILSGVLIAQGMLFTTGCNKVLQTLQTVLKQAPVAVSIINTAVDLYNVVDPGGYDGNLKAEVDEYVNVGIADLNNLVSLIKTYQADLGSAPTSALQKADALVAAIQSEDTKLQAAFGLKSQKAQAEAAAIIDAVSTFLAELGQFLPANTVASAPATHALVKAQAAKASTGKVKIISAGDLARKFNSASAANFPQINVAVP